MIDYVKGRVVKKGTNFIVVESNNIGYKILISKRAVNKIKDCEDAKILTFMDVKEDSINLIGFSDEIERDMFSLLTSVSKIGTKTAIEILSTYSPSNIAKYVVNEDLHHLTKISGIGKKTAERLIVEIKDKVEEFLENSEDDGFNYDLSEETEIDNSNLNEKNKIEDIVEGFISLGYSRKESEDAGNKAYKLNKDASVEELIKLGLMILSKKR